MRILFLLVSFISLFSIHTLYSQQAQNPFDVNGAGKTMDTLVIEKTTTNVFDINTEKATIPIEETKSIENPEIHEPQDLEGSAIENSSERVQVDTASPPTSSTVSQSDNPFDMVKGLPLSSIKKNKIIAESQKTGEKNKTPVFKKRERKNVESGSSTFLFWPVLLCTIALAFIINMKGNVLVQNINALTNDNVLKLNQRIENNGLTIPYIVLYLIFIIGSSVFLYIVLRHFTSYMILSSLISCLLFIIAVYIIRHLFLYLVGRVFDIEAECDQYNFTIVTYNILFGILLIPLNLLMIFGPETITLYLLYFGIAVFAILFIIRILRGIIVVLPIVVQNKLQFFTYLCTFEILPLLIFIKVVYL